MHARPASLSLGTTSFPHDDDPPIVRTLTYDNRGTGAITLALSGTLTRGAAATDGLVPQDYRPGQVYAEPWHRAPFGPSFAPEMGEPMAARIGDQLRVSPSPFSEVFSPSRIGRSFSAIAASLVRDGQVVFDAPDVFWFRPLPYVAVPPEPATYRFEQTATLLEGELSTRVSGVWTFRSQHVPGGETRVLPLPVLRFSPQLDDDNRAPRRLPLFLPAHVERPPGAATPAIAHVAIEASFDDGVTWTAVPGVAVGERWFGVVRHPPRELAAHVSLRGTARDVDGNHVEQTIIRAYGLAP